MVESGPRVRFLRERTQGRPIPGGAEGKANARAKWPAEVRHVNQNNGNAGRE